MVGGDAGVPDEGAGVDPSALKEALATWASTVTVVATRDGDDIHAVTVTSFFSVSVRPPLVAVSLGANARPLPWLDPGATFTVSFLAEGQRRIASAYADPVPTMPSPFTDEAAPGVEGAVTTLVCTVEALHPTEGGARLVLGRVREIRQGGGERPLLYWRRGYRGLADTD